MSWYLAVLKKYAVFGGRSQRAEYWYFFLFNVLISIALRIMGAIVAPIFFALVSLIYGLAVLLPGIGVAIRRMHDTGRSGWWLLISIVPVVGTIIAIVFLAQDSHPDENKYGLNPKVVAPALSPQATV